MLPSNKLQQPDHNMNIISSLNFVQLHHFIGSNEEEFAGDTETDITGTVGEESETESLSLQPNQKIRHNYYYYYYYYKI